MPALGLPVCVGSVTDVDVDVAVAVPPGFSRESLVIAAWMVKYFLHRDPALPDFERRYGVDPSTNRLLRPCSTQVRWCHCHTMIMLARATAGPAAHLFVFLVDPPPAAAPEVVGPRPLCAFGLCTPSPTEWVEGPTATDHMQTSESILQMVRHNAYLAGTSWEARARRQPLWLYERGDWRVYTPER